MKINSIQSPEFTKMTSLRESVKTTETSFSDVLNGMINEVQSASDQSKSLSNQLMTGEVDNLHDVFIAGSKSELTLNMAIEVKNRVLEAYKEIMRIQF